MEWLTDKQISGKVLDHLGLVAATIDKLGLVEKIDARLPVSKQKGAKVSMGQRISAMILNGLGFMDNRLYMFPEFLENKPVARLLGDNLNAEHFNDDALGRCLDRCHAYGVTQLFSELAFEIGAEHHLLGSSVHFDTSSLCVHGEYKQTDVAHIESKPKEEDASKRSDEVATSLETPILNYGYSKDHRPDLKQVVINLATSGASGFPIWFESHSGNASDKKILLEASLRMQKFCQSLSETPSFMYVADSAMYEASLKKGGGLLWLSRVPGRLKAAKELLSLGDEHFNWKRCGTGYRICVIENQYKGHHQRWCIVSSEQAYQREIKTLEANIEKQEAQLDKELWHMRCQPYGCEKDAAEAFNQFKKKLKYHGIEGNIVAVKKYKGKGRPCKHEKPMIAYYKIEGELKRDQVKIDLLKHQKGRFILATNQLDRSVLPDEKILTEYKEQSKTESGFKFIKDDAFEVSSIFLKKPSRIAALMMVMTLCLMVYSFAQHHLRESLKKANDTVADQGKKRTQKPTLKRVFKAFHGVQVITIHSQEHQQVLVINLNPWLKKIVNYFGSRAVAIYDLSG